MAQGVLTVRNEPFQPGNHGKFRIQSFFEPLEIFYVHAPHNTPQI